MFSENLVPAPRRQDHVEMRNSPYLTATIALAACVIVVLSSILCLALKITTYNSYMEQTGHGTSQTTVTSLKYGADGFINLYPKDLVPVARAPLVLAAGLGLVTGLAITCLIARFFQTKRVLQVRAVANLGVKVSSSLTGPRSCHLGRGPSSSPWRAPMLSWP